ncbi:MAG: phosphatidylserine/phosphatidylglycerophosphate/cardiolipin synthase family protein [Candidatus Hermodarchaeota archaeon]
MLNLDDLKAKWFLDVSSSGKFPPQTRHPGSQLKPYTDGNNVDIIIDGKDFMAHIYNKLHEMTLNADKTSSDKYHFWIASWRFEPVKLLGSSYANYDAISMILEAANAGVKVFYLGSGHFGHDGNLCKFIKQLKEKGSDGTFDKRFRRSACHHSKFSIFFGPKNDYSAYLGSVDIAFSRWDDHKHKKINPERPKNSNGPTHDVSVRITGPAVNDIALFFAEQWNDTTNRNRTQPKITTTIPTTFLNTSIPPTGTHSVQVLLTYPIVPKRGFSWSNEGEFTVWAAYLKAIKQANKYIYIEDQYFYAFNFPPAYRKSPSNKLFDSDLVSQLGEAIKKGVDIIVLVPLGIKDRFTIPIFSHSLFSFSFFNSFQLYQRNLAINYLHNIAASNSGRFIICYLWVDDNAPTVHSKLMIVDDEFVLIGCSNICQRSMAHDSEIHLGIVDSQNKFAQQMRIKLWQEHMELNDPTNIMNPTEGIEEFLNYAKKKLGRIRFFPINHQGRASIFQSIAINRFIDPYSGPSRT